MSPKKHDSRRIARVAAAGMVAAMLAIPAVSLASRVAIPDNTARMLERAQDLGAESAIRIIEVTVWLRAASQEAAADRIVGALYDRSSPTFHRWMSNDEVEAALSPATASVATIRQFLADHKLTVSAVGAGNHYVRATGSIGDVQKAFNVQIHRFQKGSRTFRANTVDPSVDDPAGSLIAGVAGLSEHHAVPHLRRALDPDTGRPFAARRLALSPGGVFFSAQCLRDAETHTFTTGGGLPSATYFGNRYGQDIANTDLGTLAPCGYQPSELQTAYGMDTVYNAGSTGQGQTIVIVDAYGSPTIAEDAELFSQVYGLPDVTPANFAVYFPGGQPAAPDPGWATETTLDVEWAHAMAPGANIALVIAPTSDDSDLQAAVLFAIHNGLGNVISNSYGSAEGDAPQSDLDAWNRVARLGAARGISVNFSSGDDGDSNPSGVTADLLVPGVSTPADSPWATAVGGTSVALDAGNNIIFQSGWGTNLTRIADTVALGSPPIVPPLVLGFQFGAGGGTSGYFAKPAFQSKLRGRFRMVPDIALTADPYTGVEIICTDVSCGAGTDNQPIVAVLGGTSVACPMFSGVWAVANQGLRRGGLGQAARTLYDLPPGAITDVVPVASAKNVRGILTTTTGSSIVSSPQLLRPETPVPFYSAFYNGSSTRWYVISFGTDTSLSTGFGWDNVTGLGTPNGKRFIQAVRNAND
ncbi:MAG TPA: S53 family peptidase [Burkholderiaceae bacterium]|nr:S53 family peptidase [Burkholderiaceae bacterium]